MRIAQINAIGGGGSTGRTSVELAAYLAAHGHDSRIFYSEGTGAAPYAVRYMTDAERRAHALLSRATGLQGYFSRGATRRLIRMLEEYRPDVVHLRNLHGNNICLPMLFGWLAKQKLPVVLTLHDCWAFTGKCTHPVRFDCDKFRGMHCAHCPALKDECPSWLFDHSKKMQRDRQRWFSALSDYRVVGVSAWAAAEARASGVFDAARVTSVYNWIDASVFRPEAAADKGLREKLGLADRFVVLAAATSWARWKRRDKGLAEVLHLAANLPDDCAVVLIGEVAPGEALPGNLLHIPQITDPARLAAYYAMADVYVNPSIAETFGKTTAEAMCCGTPAVVYALTASPELVEGGVGIAVPHAEGAEGILRAVLQIRREGKAAYRDVCVQSARARFSLAGNADAYVRLYEALLKKGE